MCPQVSTPFTQRMLLGGRYTTAIILKGGQQFAMVPIRHMLTAALWMTVIDGQRYIFALPGSSVYTWAPKLSKSVRIVIYDISCALPLDDHWTALQNILDELRIPRTTNILMRILWALRREGIPEHDMNWKGVDLEEFAEKLSANNTDPVWAAAVKAWVQSLPNKTITYPTHRVSDMLQDFVAPNPAWLGRCVDACVNLNAKLNKMNNDIPKPSMVWIAVVAFGILILVVVVMFVMPGMSDGISLPGLSLPGGSTSGGGGDACSAQSLMATYDDPTEIAVAQYMGELDCASLPSQVQSAVDKVDPADVVAIAQMRAGEQASDDTAPPSPTLDMLPDIPGIGGGFGP